METYVTHESQDEQNNHDEHLQVRTYNNEDYENKADNEQLRIIPFYSKETANGLKSAASRF